MSIGSPISYTAGGWEAKYNTLALPKQGLLLHAKRFDPTILAIADKMGTSRRAIQDLQYCQCDGTGYFAGTLTGSETVVSKSGTAAVTFASGRMNVGAGTLWSIVLSNGSRYEFATKTGTTSALLMDVSGNGRHLVATSFADVAALCATSKTQGSDHANLNGWSAGGLGPELVVNGGFDNGTTGWDSVYGTISVIGGKLRVMSSGTTWAYGNSSITTVPGVLYQVSASGYAGSINTFQFLVKAGTAGSDLYLSQSSGNANISGSFVATHSYASVRAYVRSPPSAGSYYDWDNVSVKLSIPSTGLVPARTDNPALDALGNPTQYPGRAKYDLKPVQSNCSTWASGTSVAITGVTGATILSKEGTAVVTIGTNVINYSSAGTLYNLKLTLTDGRALTIPFSEGAGTTVRGYDDQGTVYTGIITTSDLAAFWAGKQSTFFPGLQHGCSIGRWSPVDRAYKDEPTRTNKCTCVKANPTATTNLVKGGDAASVLSVVDDTAALAAAGLSHVCTTGKVYQLDNSLGTANASSTIVGLANNTNKHSFSIYIRKVSGTNNPYVALSGGTEAGKEDVTTTYYINRKKENLTPAAASDQLIVQARSGTVVRFILPQLEEGTTATSPIIWADTAAAATEYNGQWPANPLTPGLDCRGNALTNPPLIMNRSASYQLQGPEVFAAMGESAWFNSDGTAKTLTYDQVVAAVDGVNTFYNDRRGLAIYEQVSVPITADEQRYRMKARKYYDLGSTILEDGTVLDDDDLLW